MTLSAESTTAEYLLRFLQSFYLGLSDPVSVSDSLEVKLMRPDGTVVQKTGDE